jgi:hypothetical protein
MKNTDRYQQTSQEEQDAGIAKDGQGLQAAQRILMPELNKIIEAQGKVCTHILAHTL